MAQAQTVGLAQSVGANPIPLFVSGYPTILMIEIIGEVGVGKSHFASFAPQPLMFDTTPKGEARDVFNKVMLEKGVNPEGRYYHIVDWNDIRTRVNEIRKRTDFKSLIVDTSTDLQRMATAEYLDRASTDRKQRKNAIQIEYGKIRDIVDMEFIYTVTAIPPTGMGKNLIVTSHMKHHYKQVIGESGQVHAIRDGRDRDGYERADRQSDIRVFMSLKDICQKCQTEVAGIVCSKCGGTLTRTRRFIQVVKNRFRNKADESEWISFVDPQNWEGIKRLLKGEQIVD